jgi:hypothetical protein
MNKQQTCGFFGWTSKEFDRNVSRGFPARKKNASRGQDWQVDSREAIGWVVEQEAPKLHRRKQGKPDYSKAPRGWEAFRAAEQLEDPVHAVSMVNILWLLYALPRLIANMAAEEGVGIQHTWRISAGIVLLALEHCRQKLDFWPKDPDRVALLDAAFDPVNWPHHAVKAGEPDWRPPVYGLGWTEVTPEEFAEAVAHGEAIDEKYRRLEAEDAAA